MAENFNSEHFLLLSIVKFCFDRQGRKIHADTHTQTDLHTSTVLLHFHRRGVERKVSSTIIREKKTPCFVTRSQTQDRAPDSSLAVPLLRYPWAQTSPTPQRRHVAGAACGSLSFRCELHPYSRCPPHERRSGVERHVGLIAAVFLLPSANPMMVVVGLLKASPKKKGFVS